MRRIGTLLLALILALALAVPALAAEGVTLLTQAGPVRLGVGAGEDGKAVICYNTCGPELWYYQYTRGVLGEASTQGWVRADLGFDPTRAVLNGAEKPMAQPCEVHQQRTCLSIRYVAEAFGLTIQWDEGANTIHLFSPQA